MTQILTVTGDPYVRHVIRTLGSEGQFDFLEKEDGYGAVQELVKMAERGDKLGAVLVDEALPGVGGRTLAGILGAAAPSVPCFLLSSSPAEERGRGAALRRLPRDVSPAVLRKILVELALPTTRAGLERIVWEPAFTNETGLLLLSFAPEADVRGILDALGASFRMDKCSLVRGAHDAALILDTLACGSVEDKVSSLAGIRRSAFIPFEVPNLSAAAVLLLGASERVRQEAMDEQSTIEVNPLERARFVKSYLLMEIDPGVFERVFVVASLMQGVTECYPARGRGRIVCRMTSDSFAKIDRVVAEKTGPMGGVLKIDSYRVLS